MSHIDVGDARAALIGREAADAPVTELLEPRVVPLGRTTHVRRFLPHKERRMVGAWCFVDHYGPDDVHAGQAMWVPPHPHTSLQTVSWLVEGEILHRDSLGSHALVRPGELNLMTSGEGIAHSEESPVDGHPARLHGVQLWVALPEPVRRTTPPAFAHHDDLPRRDLEGVTATVIVGELAGATSPATAYSPLVAAELMAGTGEVPLRPGWEYAVLVLAGAVAVQDARLEAGQMLYLGTGRDRVGLSGAGDGSRVLLLGGEPFEEQLVMWWNFIGRSHEEVAQARADWMAELAGDGGDRFGMVSGFDGDPLPAPPLPQVRLRPRGRTR